MLQIRLQKCGALYEIQSNFVVFEVDGNVNFKNLEISIESIEDNEGKIV